MSLWKRGFAYELNITDNCSICLMPLLNFSDRGGLLETPCRHLFHRYCLSEWLADGQPGGNCPICKKAVKYSGPRPSVGEGAIGQIPSVPVAASNSSNQPRASVSASASSAPSPGMGIQFCPQMPVSFPGSLPSLPNNLGSSSNAVGIPGHFIPEYPAEVTLIIYPASPPLAAGPQWLNASPQPASGHQGLNASPQRAAGPHRPAPYPAIRTVRPTTSRGAGAHHPIGFPGTVRPTTSRGTGAHHPIGFPGTGFPAPSPQRPLGIGSHPTFQFSGIPYSQPGVSVRSNVLQGHHITLPIPGTNVPSNYGFILPLGYPDQPIYVEFLPGALPRVSENPPPTAPQERGDGNPPNGSN